MSHNKLPRVSTLSQGVECSSFDDIRQRDAGRQVPTFIPLPVFKFTGPTSQQGRSGSLGNINIVQCDHNSTRRNTLTTLFLATPPTQARKPLAKSPSGTPSERSFEESNEEKSSDNLLRKEARLTSRNLSRRRRTPEDGYLANTSRDEKVHADVMSRDNRRMRSVRSTHSNGESVDMGNRIMIAPRMIDDGELNSHELDFLHFSADGDIEGLRNLFVEQGYYLFHLDVNCVDSLDRTALSLATINNHVDVVKFIVNEVEGVAMGDALFYAIQSEYIETIELLLEKDPQTSIQVMPGTTSPFEPGLTPFMMAAHKNNYKILALLYKYSHRLTFSENEFILDEGFDPYSWDAVMERLLHYKARASPAFMLLMFNEKGMSWDPLNASMDLFNELHQLAQREREVEEAYCSMADGCETFALQLLQEVRSASELADLMQYDLDDDSHEIIDLDDSNDNDKENATTERRQKSRHYLKPIEKAVKFEMKDFVTSDNSQLALIYIQKGKLFRRLKGIKATVTQLFLGLLFPFLSLGLILAPQSVVGKVMGNPTVKFWCWVVSEIVFIIMLLANTILMQYDVLEGSDGISPLLAIAYFWILGKFFQEAREIYHQGLREYLSDIWNWNDMCTIVLYTLYMILRFVHIIQNPTGTRGNSGNYFWQGSMWDPLPLSDICIAVSYILIHMRIMELLRAERTFGPLQVSLDLMLHDAFRFSVIFCIVFLAFGSGITELYTPYAKNKNCTCNNTLTCNTSLPLAAKWIEPPINAGNDGPLPACVACKDVEDDVSMQLTDLYTTMEGMFWSLFGYGEPSKWLTTENCPETRFSTKLTGGIIIGLYHFGAIILLVNMLIAMMSNSFQKTHDDSEREWKFHRTQLWLKFIRNEINCPPPMNLIPRAKTVRRVFRSIGNAFRRATGRLYRINTPPISNMNFPVTGNGTNHINLQRRRTGIDPNLGGDTVMLFEGETRYTKVLRLVVLRYVKKKVLHGEMVI